MRNQKKDEITPATENAASSAELDDSQLEAVVGGVVTLAILRPRLASRDVRVDRQQDLFAVFGSPSLREHAFHAVHSDDVGGGDHLGLGGLARAGASG